MKKVCSDVKMTGIRGCLKSDNSLCFLFHFNIVDSIENGLL